MKVRAEILVGGLVQGVGFRYFVVRNAQKLGITGYTKNLFTGEVLTVAEGEKGLIENLFDLLKVGPSYADVRRANIIWQKNKNEFNNFEVRY